MHLTSDQRHRLKLLLARVDAIERYDPYELEAVEMEARQILKEGLSGGALANIWLIPDQHLNMLHSDYHARKKSTQFERDFIRAMTLFKERIGVQLQ